VTWNSDYNYELDYQRDLDRVKIAEDKKIQREKSRKLHKAQMEEKRMREDRVNKINEDYLVLSNRFSVLEKYCSEINMAHHDVMTIESCVDKFKRFKPSTCAKKPSEFEFDKMIEEFTNTVVVDEKDSTINYKEKFDNLQLKLNQLKKAIQPILLQHTKLNIKKVQEEKGFILSLIDAIKYFDDDYDSPDDYDYDNNYSD